MKRAGDARLGAYAVLAAAALVTALALRRTELAAIAAPFGELVSNIKAGPVTPRASTLISELTCLAIGSVRTNAAAPLSPYSSPSLNSSVTGRAGGDCFSS